MAEDKDKKAKGEEEGGDKKKGLPPIVLVAIGAAIGGAGVVFLSPVAPNSHVGHMQEYEPKYVLREHPDVLTFQFNPRQDRGSIICKVVYQFVYKIDERDEEHVLEQIKTHWNLMNSDVLLRLRRETPQSLRDTDANQVLANELKALMSATLFPEGAAVVTRIVWKSFYLQ